MGEVTTSLAVASEAVGSGVVSFAGRGEVKVDVSGTTVVLSATHKKYLRTIRKPRHVVLVREHAVLEPGVRTHVCSVTITGLVQLPRVNEKQSYC